MYREVARLLRLYFTVKKGSDLFDLTLDILHTFSGAIFPVCVPLSESVE